MQLSYHAPGQRAEQPAPEGAGPEAGRRADWLGGGVLLALAAATRGPLLGRTLGGSDCARFLVGMEQWLRAGRQAPFLYGSVFSPGYYALGLGLVRATGWTPGAVLAAITLAATLAAAPLLYLVGARLTGRGAAMAGAVLFLLAPGYWWLGIEPHPQQASFLCLLVALACVLGGEDWRWRAAAAVSFGLGLLLKNDLVLVAGIFPALAWRGGRAGRGRRAAASLWVPGAGAAMFLLGRSWILGQGWGQAQGQTLAAVAMFLQLPRGVEGLKQAIPLVFTGGVATAALLAGGLALGLREREWRRRWGLVLAAWAAPGVVFFLLVQGNSTRHMIPYLLLPLYAACEAVLALLRGWARLRGWERAWRWPGLAVGVLLAATIGLNWAAVPANSNTTLFPSANVPGSARDLARRTGELRAWFAATAGAGGGGCYLGNGTLPYMELAWLQASPRSTLARPPAGLGLKTRFAASAGGMTFVEVNSAPEYVTAARRCGPPARSLEYAPDGHHRRFLGREWTWLPLARRWYR